MNKMLSVVLIGMLCLVPVLAAAQTGGAGGGKSSAPGSTNSGSGSSSDSSSTGSMSTPSSGSSSSGSSTSPSASPSTRGSSDSKSLSTITNKADCEAAGGNWQMSTYTCQAKK